MENEQILMEKSLKKHIDGIWPLTIVVSITEKDLFYLQLRRWAEEDGLDLTVVEYKVNVDYRLFDFFQDEKGDWQAMFVAHPLCWTDNPDNWWWKQRRYNPEFQSALLKASNLSRYELVSICKVESCMIPSVVEVDDNAEIRYVEEQQYWRFAS